MAHRIASFHLQRDGSAVRAMARLGTDRLRLRSVPGLRFWRLLGTGHGSNTGRGADPHRTALFAVWEDSSHLDAFLASSLVQERQAAADEWFVVRLLVLGGQGVWRGFDVLGAVDTAVPSAAGEDPVAVVTQANVKVRHWRTFGKAGGPVSDELQSAPGLLRVAGVGEAPIGRQATFSLWRSAAELQHFAYRMPRHAEVVRRTRAEGWYGEELFARFHPFGAEGTWDGTNPLAP
jgi:hypothetical protein